MNNLIPGFDRLARALAELSAARRMAAGTLVVMVIVTAVWAAGRIGGGDGASGAMEPVLDQAFAPTDLAQICHHLKSRSVPFEVRQGKVFVPADRKLDLLSDLYLAQIITSNTTSGFDELVRQISPLDTPGKTEKLFNHARELTVERVISRFAGVRKATVIIDPTSERRMAGSVLPSAMVDIQTHGPARERELSSAAVNVLTGAVANLSRERVKVTINGATWNAGGDDSRSIELVERKQRCEQMYASKVRNLLSYIPEALVSVSVDLDQEPDEPAKAQADEGAVVANAVPLAGDARPPMQKEMVRSASVAIPRSHFVQIYLRANSKAQAPDDALLQPVVDAHLPRIRGLVKNALGLADDQAVSVEMYEDALPAASKSGPEVAAAVTPAVVPPVGTAWDLNAYGNQFGYAAVGVLTLLALAIMLRRSSAPQRVSTALGPAPMTPQREVLSTTVEGVADDPDDAHQLFRRVRDMVSDHPDDAAKVLKNWIYQDG
jgi:flagellar biosynthesis/type III secretory pathway M-ring protein FliF/YscJ